MIGTAKFSSCKRYRYILTRRWLDVQPIRARPGGRQAARCVFIMLNPSTADASADDRTVARCIAFASSWGYGELVVLNLFALRSTDPRRLLEADDPVGPGNDEAIRFIVSTADKIVAAWGSFEVAVERSRQVLALIPGPVDCLGRNASGAPKHPLYIKSDTALAPFRGPR